MQKGVAVEAMASFLDPAVTLQGYTLKPQMKWTTGDIKGYNEGDCVPYKLKLDKKFFGQIGKLGELSHLFNVLVNHFNMACGRGKVKPVLVFLLEVLCELRQDQLPGNGSVGRFRVTRSVAIFSTNSWAARRSTFRRRPSQSSFRRQRPMVCAFTPSLAAISAFFRKRWASYISSAPSPVITLEPLIVARPSRASRTTGFSPALFRASAEGSLSPL
jgi:hypothetical protein